MSTLYLIRHAQACFGQADYDQLSSQGKSQAVVLANRFIRQGVVFNAVYLGSQRRHAQTLDIVATLLERAGKPFPPPVVLPQFNEYDSESIFKRLIPRMMVGNPALEADVGRMLGDRRLFQQVFSKVMRHWVKGSWPAEGLETWTAYRDGVLAALSGIMERETNGKTVLVFTSGGPIAVCVQKALGVCDETTLELLWQIVNAGITRFKYTGGRLTLAAFNDAAHLEMAEDGNLVTYR